MARQLKATILDYCISFQIFLDVLGVVDVCHLLLTTFYSQNTPVLYRTGQNTIISFFMVFKFDPPKKKLYNGPDAK
jgi:hypothetical protein